MSLLLSIKLKNIFKNIYYFICFFDFSSSLLMLVISSFKCFNPLLILSTRILFLLRLFFEFLKFFSTFPRSLFKKYFFNKFTIYFSLFNTNFSLKFSVINKTIFVSDIFILFILLLLLLLFQISFVPHMHKMEILRF